MQKNTTISFKLFPFLMAILMLVALGAEAVYAVTSERNDVSVSVEKDVDQEEGQQKPTYNVLKDQSTAIPQSTETVNWCNVFVKTLHQLVNFRLTLKPVAKIKPTKEVVETILSTTATCIYSYYAAPNAP
ncbi:hypothetical protein [Flammeovirga sp. EKP202]|uniref:hypothetical protein n=1 Tax=Flammeovirga sp. EKP202 TaxID=2770592 RepID=UPI00165F4C80|nr:hypothetical protein [Flammeovirga sp. EKP202]MBD0403317.1 hypothetical protein [Flammeovirga sp. EKP202]